MSEQNVVDQTVVTPAAVVPVVRDIEQILTVALELAPAYKMRKTNSKTFRCMTPIENENANWKKGLVYLAARYSKGINFELWLYSTKKGAHLAEFNDKFRTLANDTIKCEALGLAVKLRVQLPDAMADDVVRSTIEKFLATVEPTVTEVRALVPAVVSKAETAKAAKAAAEAAKTVAVPEVPVVEATTEVAEAPVSKRQAKKAAKRAAKAA